MYRQTLQEKLAIQFTARLNRRGLNTSKMSYNDLLYEWACFMNDIASRSRGDEYKGIETRIRFPKAILMHNKEDLL